MKQRSITTLKFNGYLNVALRKPKYRRFGSWYAALKEIRLYLRRDRSWPGNDMIHCSMSATRLPPLQFRISAGKVSKHSFTGSPNTFHTDDSEAGKLSSKKYACYSRETGIDPEMIWYIVLSQLHLYLSYDLGFRQVKYLNIAFRKPKYVSYRRFGSW